MIGAIALCGSATAFPTDSIDFPKLISIAHKSIEAEIRGKKPPESSDSQPPNAVFVTIERNGKVLGCRGSLTPRTKALETEVIAAARSAAKHDPRYRPLTEKDLPGLLVTITVVQRQVQIESVENLKPEDGLVLIKGGSTGVVLPWEGKDPKIRLQWAYRKAGVKEGTPARLYRLIAERCRG